MSFIKTFLVVFLVLATSVALAQVQEEWVARYNGPGNGGDGAGALAVDVSGNVYVTGSSWGSRTDWDYATIKYDADGNQLWVARYNGPGNGEDHAGALAVDVSGNVYVTGWSVGSGTSRDYATIKYDPDGNELWVARFNGSADLEDRARALALDDSGNVYVTGSCKTGPGSRDYDYATIKYDSSGNELWVARYNGPGNADDGGQALALDAEGNVYVTGFSEGSGTSYDYATVKYDPDGNELWVARYNSPANYRDEATALAVDESGNVHVGGLISGSPTSPYNFDYLTIKYDSTGSQLWVARYAGPGGDLDLLTAVGLDASANVYVTGWSEGCGTSSDYATIKYDPNGNQLWVARYNGPGNGHDGAYALAADAEGNVYVTGHSWDPLTLYDYTTIKYDSHGDSVWVVRYNGPGNGWDMANALAVDTEGNVYVTGGSEGSGTSGDYATIKYSHPALEISCETAVAWFCRGRDFSFKLTITNSTGGNVSGTLTFSGYSAYDCDPGNVLISIRRPKTFPPGVTEQYYRFKVPNAVGPGQYSTSISGTLGGVDLFCCMNTDIVECGPWKSGGNTEWDLVEVDRPDVALPTATELYQNYPNPFNATTQFSYSLAEAGNVRLTIHNLRGQLVETVVDGHQEAGEHQVIWDASNLSSGVYFYKLQAGDFVSTKKMNLLK